MQLPVRWRYKIDRWRSQISSHVSFAAAVGGAPATVPGLRHPGGLHGQALPSMRREPDVFHGRGQPLAEQLPAADRAGQLRHPGPLLRSLRRQPARDHQQHRLRGAHAAAWARCLDWAESAAQSCMRMGLSGPFDLAQPWRFITAIFLHGSLLHIGFNMWVLMDLGPTIEEMYGSARFLFIFIATGRFRLRVERGHRTLQAWAPRARCLA